MSSDAATWLANLAYTKLVGTALPARLFGPPAPAVTAPVAARPVRLEIVAHCWRYAHMLRFQLSSLALHPPTRLALAYTLYHAEDDAETAALAARFGAREVPGVEWRWRPVPRERLLRRAIGRNEAALASAADWLWFADCDLIFHAGCLDSLAPALESSREPLLYPADESITALLADDHPLLAGGRAWRGGDGGRDLVDIDPALFAPNRIEKAKGAFQIVRGDVARAVGYCRDLALYQRPTDRWRKTYEDTAFRRLLGTEGVPVAIDALYRIRHREKGRYGDAPGAGPLRARVRRWRDALR